MLKKTAFTSLFLLTIVFTFWVQAKTPFAILPIETSGNISNDDKLEAEETLYRILHESGKYSIVERTKLEKLLKEQSLQQTGITDQSKIVEIGKVVGAEKIVTAKIYKKSGDNIAVSISVIDIATGQIELVDEQSSESYDAEDKARYCAAHIIEFYPLLGEIVGTAGDNIIVDLGQTHGLKIGSRLFISRNEVIKGDGGEVLFKEEKRIGTLKVIKLNPGRSVTTVKLLEKKDVRPQKSDLVSPEPIPKKEDVVSLTPLLPDVKKGKLLLEDDMKKNKYLSPTKSTGEAYSGGRLHLNATHLEKYYAYAFYGAPLDNVENFIFEGKVKFEKTSNKYNKINIQFRSQSKTGSSTTYSFYWHNLGEYAVYRFNEGEVFTLASLQASPVIKRDESENSFRIVAYGSKFDCYLNNKFIVAFENEIFDKGRLGFAVSYGCYSSIDDVTIWEAVK